VVARQNFGLHDRTKFRLAVRHYFGAHHTLQIGLPS
jgi:hypothetical protein